MSYPTFSPSTFEFLRELAANNNREWFHEHKPRYQEEHAKTIEFADALLAAMNEIDHLDTPSGKKALFRIYRDVRFAKDKRPYKNHFSGHFRRATAKLRGGYYFHMEPGNVFLAGGFWGPNWDDLLRIRQEIATDASELRDVLADKKLQKYFGGLSGDQLKTSPRGFDRDHPDVDLLRYKQFILSRSFTDKEALGKDFIPEMVATFGAMRPFLDYMSDVLTTDANGVSIV